MPDDAEELEAQAEDIRQQLYDEFGVDVDELPPGTTSADFTTPEEAQAAKDAQSQEAIDAIGSAVAVGLTGRTPTELNEVEALENAKERARQGYGWGEYLALKSKGAALDRNGGQRDSRAQPNPFGLRDRGAAS